MTFFFVNKLELGASVSMAASPSVVPANHAGTIRIAITGKGTAFDGTTVFTPGAGLIEVGQHVIDIANAYLDVTTGATTGPIAITESVTGNSSANVTIATATISVTPTTALLGTTPTLTITTENMVLTQEVAVSLLLISGGTGASLGLPTINNDNQATVVLTGGAGTGTLTITLNPVTGGVSDTVGVGAATAYYILPAGPLSDVVDVAKNLVAYANGTTAAVVTGHTDKGGVYSGTIQLSGTTQVPFTYTPNEIGVHTLSFTNSASLTNPSNIVLTVTQFPASVAGGSDLSISLRIGI